MPNEAMPESDAFGKPYVIIDQEVDKIIAALTAISEQLESAETNEHSMKLKRLLDQGIAPYVADFAQILNNMEEVE